MSGGNILSLLGLALRGGRLAAGDEPTALAAQGGKARLVLLASDAGEKTLRRGAHLAEEGNCLILTLPFSKAELGGALGRSSTAIMALTDLGLANALSQKLAALDRERYGETARRMELKLRRARERKTAPRRQPPSPERREPRPGGGKRPADGAKRFADGGKRPADGVRRPSDSGKKPTSGGRRPSDGAKRFADGGKRPADGAKKPFRQAGPPGGGEERRSGGKAHPRRMDGGGKRGGWSPRPGGKDRRFRHPGSGGAKPLGGRGPSGGAKPHGGGS
ncbi:MAG: 50S ribosomal protein L7 [Oscillibacter sp.]|nr:50S ribosomal protein L7 [Oscillibacter sp.]